MNIQPKKREHQQYIGTSIVHVNTGWTVIHHKVNKKLSVQTFLVCFLHVHKHVQSKNSNEYSKLLQEYIPNHWN